MCFSIVAKFSKKVLTLQHYWWSNWCWKKKTQVDDKPHECLWKTRSHYTQFPIVHCNRPPDDQMSRRHWWIHFALASGHQIVELWVAKSCNVRISLVHAVTQYNCWMILSKNYTQMHATYNNLLSMYPVGKIYRLHWNRQLCWFSL